ncbi:MAG: phytanoyl-CoA dioxygenase family protein [Phycisphaeraceae bacterium]
MVRTTDPPVTLSDAQLTAYEQQGYLIVPGLFDAADVQRLRTFFDDLAERGEPVERNGGSWQPDLSDAGRRDPLKRYPRVMHPHRFDKAVCQRYLLDQRVHGVLRALLKQEPVACQSMFYFKPPGARGQAFHQDNFYLAVKPDSCIAAWTAIDPSRPDNGGLFICPGTHRMDLVCPEQAESDQSFTTELVRPPAGIEPVPAELEPGDVLFFNGSVIHGSYPNATQDQWRRSFICHYMPTGSTHISQHYFPLLDFAGREVHREKNTDGGPCGTPFGGVE